MPRRLIDPVISFVSFCARGANGMAAIYKADSGEAVFETKFYELAKFDERGLLTAAVYVPDRPDLQDDWCDRATVEKMAHSFMLNGAKLDMVHDEKPVPADRASVVESFIIAKGDERFADVRDVSGKRVDCEHGWGIVVKITDPNLRKEYREGKWNGVSLGGKSKFKDEAPPIYKEAPMSITLDQMNAALSAANAPLTAALAEIAKHLKPSDPPADKPTETPVAKVDFTDPKALRKRALELKAEKIDQNDPEALEKLAKEIEESQAGEGEGDEGDEGVSDVRKAKLAKASRQPAGSPPAEKTKVQKAVQLGADLAKAIKERQGGGFFGAAIAEAE